MPTFDAAVAVDPMICKLPQVGFEGTIPEPSTAQVQEFMNARHRELELMRKQVADVPEDADIEETLKLLGPKQTAAAVKRKAKMYSDLCSGTPSADQLAALPHRVFDAFAVWIAEEILNPEAASGAGRTAGTIPPSAAAA